jgi:hypothetical protein
VPLIRSTYLACCSHMAPRIYGALVFLYAIVEIDLTGPSRADSRPSLQPSFAALLFATGVSPQGRQVGRPGPSGRSVGRSVGVGRYSLHSSMCTVCRAQSITKSIRKPRCIRMLFGGHRSAWMAWLKGAETAFACAFTVCCITIASASAMVAMAASDGPFWFTLLTASACLWLPEVARGQQHGGSTPVLC